MFSYLLYYGILLPLSYLPLRVLYWLSDLTFLVVYNLTPYRKEVVFDNMRRSFPEWDEARVESEARQFYRYLFDTIAESIKLFSMSEDEAVRRGEVRGREIVDHLVREERSYICAGGHYANWEVCALSFPRQFAPHKVMGVFAPLKNPVMNRLVHENRGRYGVHLVPMSGVTDFYETMPLGLEVAFYAADQNPSNHVWELLHATTFLNQPTVFLAGPERFAVRYNHPVYYITIRRESRGVYKGGLIKITDNPREEEPGFITEQYVRILENEIRNNPTTWLWSHRRWKRTIPERIVEKLKTQPFIAAEFDRSPR